MSRRRPAGRRTILLPFFGDLGDTILVVPAVRALRERYPDARLILLAMPLTISILTRLGLIDEAIAADKHSFDRTSSLLNPRALWTVLRLLRKLHRARADTLILFHHLVTRWGGLKFAVLALGSGATDRIGLDNGRGWFLTRRVVDRGFGQRHEAQYWLDVAEAAGASGTLRLEFPVGADDRAAARALLARSPSSPGPLIAIHPGVGSYAPGRRWPTDRFARVARTLRDGIGARTVLVGTEQDAAETGEVRAGIGADVLDLTGRTSVQTLAAVLEMCDVVIANDGGVAHLAAAVGTPVVAVFGPSNDRAWGPVGGTVVKSDLPCRPCFYRDFERGLRNGCSTRECLTRLSPELLVEAVVRLCEAPARAV